MLSPRITRGRRALVSALVIGATLAVIAAVPAGAGPGRPTQERAAPASDEPVMIIHEVTGLYLETDNYHDNVGEAVQTWNLDPPMTAPGYIGHKWILTRTGNYHLIKSFEHRRCLTASQTSAPELPRLQECDGTAQQAWIFSRFQNTDSFAIIPSKFDGYGLGIHGGTPANNQYVTPTPYWGAPTWSQYWRVTPAPAA